MTGGHEAGGREPGYEEIADQAALPSAPVVSVLMITYNHGQYLAEAIEGVLAQACPFPFELVIGEDASTDDTLAVALDYQRRFPDRIRLLRSLGNVGFQANIRRIFAASRGRYIAWCEGDDYWCATDKLARQVAMLEADGGIGVVHTDWVRTRSTADGWRVDWRHSMHRRVPRSLLEGNLMPTFHYPRILRTCTRMARREVVAGCFESALGQGRYRFFDAVLAAYACAGWRIGYLPEVTAVYRETPHSILRSGVASRIGFLRSSLDFDADARAYFRDRPDYPQAYRWELAIGLLLWGARGRDVRAMRQAISDLRRHFGISGFLRAASATLAMRRPSLRALAPSPRKSAG